MNTRALAFRLSVWYAAVLSVAFLLVGGAVYFGLEQYLRSSARDTVSRRLAQTVQVLRDGAAPGTQAPALREAISQQVAPEYNNRFVRITRLPATVIYESGPPANHSFVPAAVPATAEWTDTVAVQRVTPPTGGPLLIGRRRTELAGSAYGVEFGVSLESADALREGVLGLLALLLPALALLAAGGGFVLVGRALRPVEAMSRQAEQISISNLAASLPVPPTGDALQGLAVSLNHMLDRLRESVQTAQRFLADASHELRTPLTVIKCELDGIAERLGDGAEDADRIGSMREELARLEHLVEGLLTISRLDAGEAQTESVRVDLAELAGTTAEQMRLVADEAGIRLDVSALAPAATRGDRARLKQVIVNLLDNALKYTGRGGHVALTTWSEGGESLLEVRDSGIGIPAADLPRIFDRFYRVDEARSRDSGGMGLGLAIVRAICAGHGAHIDATSEPGRGSTFRVRFPVAR